ncbi:hypothetical protein JJB99_30790 [Bradyrhizobium diazoefficiens]|uniref:hypothetical protein n=1 Tax=Bradyrhizobium diazoefficiens TaxID=1355477 RepID=UPI00190CDD28|nr:hypothetical protein [Bradyrhizobium diazoefficiens]QQO13736.1 hypothetical protein JJB99_30790 [Bradyrhizobium diazoefficiens]
MGADLAGSVGDLVDRGKAGAGHQTTGPADLRPGGLRSSRRSPSPGDPVFDISGGKRFGFQETKLHQPRHDLMVEHRRADPGFAEEPSQKITFQI